MRLRLLLVNGALLFTLFGLGCSDNSPTQQTLFPATLQLAGQGSWIGCGLFSCTFGASIQNVGAGCAGETTVIARFYDSANQQVGSDVQMGAVGTSLFSRVIRPQEIVAIASVVPVSGDTIANVASYRLFPTWTNMRC